MARPIKKGLDYFPFDIDFFEDEKMGPISGEFGIKGEITTIKLLCAVYRNGYFVVWNDLLKMKLLKTLPGITSELIEQILNRLIKWEFFNQDLFNSDKILTSSGIQKRYFEAIKRRRSDEDYPYLLVNVCNNDVNACNNIIIAYKNTQRKEKESKETIPPIPPLQDEVIITVEDLKKQIFDNETAWYEGIAMKFHLKPAGITAWLNEFFDELILTGEKLKSLKDFKSHFYRWLKIQLEKQKKETNHATATDQHVY